MDPRCSLRTRVKRSALARFERNFFSWRIDGEGPKRPNNNNGNGNNNGNNGNHVRRKRGRRQQQQQQRGDATVKQWDEQSAMQGSVFTMNNMTMNMDQSQHGYGQQGPQDYDTVVGGSVVVQNNQNNYNNPNQNNKEMSYGQRNVWKEKMKKKLLRNSYLQY